MVRGYRIIHEPLLAEWLVRTYPLGTWRVNVRVGPISPELLKLTIRPELRRVLKITVASVDAIVFLPDETHIIECMVRDEPGKLSELEMYRDLFLSDPDFKERWRLPVRLILLSAIPNPFIKMQAEKRGIRFVFYRPRWVERYLGTLPARFAVGRLHSVPAGES